MMKMKSECFKIMSCVAKRKLEGVMVHDALADAFLVMNLYGFSEFHRKREKAEFKEFHKVKDYIIERHGEIPSTDGATIEDTSILYFHKKYNRENLNSETKRKICSYLFEYIVDWESETIELLSGKYKELMSHGAIAEAIYVANMIEDTDKELEGFIRCHTRYEDTNYDIVDIYEEQDED